MREILFRGKRADNENWVCGLLVKQVDLDGSDELCIQTWERDNEGVSSRVISVIPSTVGQYTGLTDKNGVRIFEGDIVEFYFFDKTRRNGELITVKNTKTMLIEWYETSFDMRELFRNYQLDNEMGVVTEITYDYKGKRKQGVYKSNSVYFIEVIGNIHDTPELVKGV